MGLIAVEGMRFYAYHGFYKEEQKIGQYYLVDVHVHTDFEQAAEEDSLYATINYETIYLAAKIELNKPTRLLETIATRITDSLKNKFANIEEIRVRVSKLQPPLGGEVDRTFVEVHHDHRTECAATDDPMLCYGDKNCWCNEVLIQPEVRKKLNKKFDGCLSPEALKMYAVT